MMRSRRTFLIELGRGAFFVATYPILTSGVLDAATIEPTPPNTEGPFYVPNAPSKGDLREAGDAGTVLVVAGSIVEVWHTDPAGRYDMDGFRYRSRIKTSSKGEYRFQTYMPAGYSGRPRHIHYKISAPGHELLTTQLYFENDPFFEGKPDENVDKDRLIRYRELIQPVVPYSEGKSLSVQFRICLARA
jgi:protocatechuate 3,4-dioxygenase beta subunit